MDKDKDGKQGQNCQFEIGSKRIGVFSMQLKQAQKNKCIFNGAKTQVTGHWDDQFIVILDEKTCTCRHWKITGILCSHAISEIWEKN